jgi:hypothetical protein
VSGRRKAKVAARAGMTSGIKETFQQVGVVVGIAALGSFFESRVVAALHPHGAAGRRPSVHPFPRPGRHSHVRDARPRSFIPPRRRCKPISAENTDVPGRVTGHQSSVQFYEQWRS